MKRTIGVAVCLLLAVTLATAQAGISSGSEPRTKSVSGQVLGSSNQPLPNAIVYLKNTKTLAVKTFIAQNDGGYRFHALSPNVDYELYAEYNGQRSDNKTISQFDSRSQLTIQLKIRTER